MADFCKECSERLFGPGFNDAKGLTTEAGWKEGKAAFFLCEDCGYIQVDPEGRCVSPDCLQKGMIGHGGIPDRIGLLDPGREDMNGFDEGP